MRPTRHSLERDWSVTGDLPSCNGPSILFGAGRRTKLREGNSCCFGTITDGEDLSRKHDNGVRITTFHSKIKA